MATTESHQPDFENGGKAYVDRTFPKLDRILDRDDRARGSRCCSRRCSRGCRAEAARTRGPQAVELFEKIFLPRDWRHDGFP